MRISAAAEATMTIVYAAAIVAVALPHVRERIVERAYRLTPADESLLGRLATDCEARIEVPVTSNFARSDESAITYPRGWRPQIGIFAPTIVGLSSDPERASFVVRHELAHARAGDHLLGGAIGPLRPISRFAVPVLLVVVLLTIAFPDAYSEARAAAIINAANSLLLLSGLVVALWLSELEADRHAVETGTYPADTFGGRRRLIGLLTHPPRWLRQRAVGAWRSTPRATIMLLVYPVSVAARWLGLTVVAVIALSLVPQTTVADSWGFIDESALWAARRSATDMLVFGALLATWPTAGWFWRRIWGVDTDKYSAHFRRANLVAGGVCMTIAGLVRQLT